MHLPAPFFIFLFVLPTSSHGFATLRAPIFAPFVSRASVRKQQCSKSISLCAAQSQLEQLSKMTTLSIDSGDLATIEKYANTGFITDATTNPLFVSQAGLSGDPVYANLVSEAVSYALSKHPLNKDEDESETVALAIDRLAVNLGADISKIVKGYISTEVNAKLSFDTDASIDRARRIIAMYTDLGVPKHRILIKLAATWEGICAAAVLEKEGIRCNLTLVFSYVQAVACAQRGIHLISPFPGRILDWYNAQTGRTNGVQLPEMDEGVIACRRMHNYFKKYGYDTICMPASWRPSRGKGFELDEICALAGTDRMTIPAPLLKKLEECTEKLPRMLDAKSAMESDEEMSGGEERVDEKKFRYRMNMDGCGTEKLADGIRAFIAETDKLEAVITEKVRTVAGE